MRLGRIPSDSTDQNLCRSESGVGWVATCKMLAVVFLGVAIPSGPDKKYSSFDPIAVGPLPFIMWPSTTSQQWSAPINKLMVNCLVEVTGWAKCNPLRWRKSARVFLFKFYSGAAMVAWDNRNC